MGIGNRFRGHLEFNVGLIVPEGNITWKSCMAHIIHGVINSVRAGHGIEVAVEMAREIKCGKEVPSARNHGSRHTLTL